TRAASAHRHDYSVGVLIGNLQTHSALTGDHPWIIVGVHKDRAALFAYRLSGAARLLVIDAAQYDILTVLTSRLDLRDRRRFRHHDRRLHSRSGCGIREGLAVVSSRSRHHTTAGLFPRQRHYAIVSSPKLE